MTQFNGVMVSVLAIRSKVNVFKPGQSDEFLRTIKIGSMPSFGGEVKLEAQCCKNFMACKKLLV
jgi:hypothetical protein